MTWPSTGTGGVALVESCPVAMTRGLQPLGVTIAIGVPVVPAASAAVLILYPAPRNVAIVNDTSVPPRFRALPRTAEWLARRTKRPGYVAAHDGRRRLGSEQNARLDGLEQRPGLVEHVGGVDRGDVPDDVTDLAPSAEEMRLDASQADTPEPQCAYSSLSRKGRGSWAQGSRRRANRCGGGLDPRRRGGRSSAVDAVDV